MKVRTGKSLESLQDAKLSDDNLALEYRLDISASIYKRMKELGLSQKKLAVKLGMDEAQVSKIIKAKQNITISTLAKIGNALELPLGRGFRCEERASASFSLVVPRKASLHSWNEHAKWHGSVSYSNEPVLALEEVA